MDTSVLCGVIDPEQISTHDSKQSDVNHKQFYQKKDLNYKQSTSSNGDDSVADLGDAITGILGLQEVCESLPGQFEPLDRVEICHSEADVCRELIIDLAESVTGTIQKGLTKAATFPCSKKDASVDEKTETSDSRSACMRSVSLPTPLKLVSAMKGSREKQGAPLRKLTVTWAPDVYDPPATLLSHTVKSHNQQRRRTNKKNGKHKQKGKSSRGSTSDKKQSRTVANSDLRSKSMASGGRLHFGGFNQSTVELVDIVPGQESKCGSSFLRTSVAKVHVSVAEAT
ncbi:uncharacterized protein LOC122651502 isoform X2 [Telopea speciosissima]|uniref:uncharacterized protein LOC122651502 isoform X1 n=1 Tax=Telopea speciosissima TaxID=54955 RepID=UPI001CC6E95F|nr:uncharacterized protein LOC122651502 isoform X1 [Telopea speciosissima]XP_043700845.1 uncharacterized protein LOC122651502 isoform X2 [Telopea speciosissima]